MTAMRKERNLTQVVIGLSVLAAGLLFTLDNMDILDIRHYLRYWPVALIAIGVSQIIQARQWSAYSGAVIWMLVGLWLLGRTTGVIRVGIGDLWPLLLASLGAFLVFRGWKGYGRNQRGCDVTPCAPGRPDTDDFSNDGWATPSPAPPPLSQEPERPIESLSGSSDRPASPGGSGRSMDNTVNLFVVMGGVSRRLSTQDFRGGSAVAIMGGCKIDLRDASIGKGDAVINVLAVWGGVEIKVPEGWVIVPHVFPFMGGFDDRTRTVASFAPKRLIVRGLAMMGGVEVRH